MAIKYYLSQRTDKHVVKRLDASFTFDASFGDFGTLKTDDTGLNFPWAIAADGSDNIYVCDGNNERIVKLDSGLTFVDKVDVSSEIGRPHAIFFDSGSGDLYVVGIKDYLTISIARITTALSISKFSSSIRPADTNDQPMGISPDFTAGFFLISGQIDLLKVEETGGGFDTATTVAITGESEQFLGNIMHSNGDLYLNTKKTGSSVISRVNSSYENIGDSNKISKASFYLTEGPTGEILLFDNDNNKVEKFDANLNFDETVFTDSSPASGFIVPPGLFIDFDHGLGPTTVPIPPAFYPSGAALAAVIKFALDTSGPPTGNVYTVTFGGFTPGFFDIIQDPGGTGIFNLFLATMPVSGGPASLGPVIGFLTDKIQVGPGLPPGVPPGPPHVGDIPVSPTAFPIFTDGKEIYGILQLDV